MVEFTLFDILTLPPGKIGRLGFSTEVTSSLADERGGKLKQDDFVGHVLEFLGDFEPFTHHFKKVKREVAAKELELQVEAEEGTPYHFVSISLAKLVRLPGEQPPAELQELCDLFASFKPLFVSYPGGFPSISVQNDRDEDGRTYGTLRVGMREATDAEEAAASAAEDEAMRRIAASPVLSAWLQQLALDLDTIGPYSWFRWSSENFFEFDEDPVNEYLLSNPAPRKPKTREPKILEIGRRGRQHTGKKHNFFADL
jgi:hypothetical protein